MPKWDKMSQRFTGENASEGKREGNTWRMGEPLDHSKGLTCVRKRGQETVWVKTLPAMQPKEGSIRPSGSP